MRSAGALLGVSMAAIACGARPAVAAPHSVVHRLGTAQDPAQITPGLLDLASASLSQSGPQLSLNLRTYGDWTPAELDQGGRRLCLDLSQETPAWRAVAVCVTTGRRGGPALRATALNRDGEVVGRTGLVPATAIQNPDQRSLSAHFAAADLGLKPGRLRWHVDSRWPDSVSCPDVTRPTDGCSDRMPDRGDVKTAIEPTIFTGCVPHGPYFVGNGPRDRRVVSITFDDGPSQYTHQILDILARKHVHATFFLIGQQVRPFADLVRRELAEGHWVADHTYTHASVGGGNYSQVAHTQDVIRAVTGGFTTCLFRFPYGAAGSGGIAVAKALGMVSIQWDVDPQDWARPGADTIYSRILSQVRPGSIILDHDGGGPRNQTVTALPRVIDTLRARGYTFVTLPELLDYRQIYG